MVTTQRPADTVTGEWPEVRPNYSNLTAAVQGEAARWNVPGLSVGVMQDGHIELAPTGVTSIETRQPVTSDTLFMIGSVSKIFTATLAQMLVQDGVLDLDEPVISYLPELPLSDKKARKAVTMRHLFSHTGGFEGDRFIDYGRGDDALAKAIAEFDTLRQWTQPGELWSYCNSGFYLAGHVIEKITGQTFEEVMRERVFEPLNLERSFFHPEHAMTYAHAVGHNLGERSDGLTIARSIALPWVVNAAGGIMSTVPDLLKFAQFHIDEGQVDGEQVLSKALTREMQVPITEAGSFARNYGIGWCVWELDDVRVVDHGGAVRGFKANFTVIPDKGFALAQLSNADPGSRAMAQIEEWALDRYRGVAKPKPDPVSHSTEQLDAVTGIYQRHDRVFTISREGSRLRADTVDNSEQTGKEIDRNSYHLEPVAERRYRVADGPNKGASLDILELDGGKRTLLRIGGRLSEKVSDNVPDEPATQATVER